MAKNQASPKKNQTLRIVAIVAAALAALLILALLFGWLSFRRLRKTWTRDQPRQFSAVSVDRAQSQKLGRLYSKARQAVESGRAETLDVEGSELNQLLSIVPEWQGLARQLSLAIDGEHIVASTSVPLHDMPGLNGRYVNGDFTIAAAAQDGKLQLTVKKVMVGDKALPDFILKKINERNLAELLQEQNSPWLKQLDSLSVNDGKLQLRTRQGRHR
jgi:hypothetical protein